MKKRNRKSRLEICHCDWITLFSLRADQRGAELLKILRDMIGINEGEKSYGGYGGGYFFEQFLDRGFRISASDEGSAKVELQGLFFTGGVTDPFKEFLRIISVVKTIRGTDWKLSRVDVAIDLFGVDLGTAFPNPKSKRYDWNFAFNYSEHQEKNKKEEMVYSGFTIRRQRWSLTIYNKALELSQSNTHAIKKSFFNKLSDENEAITRIELRLKSSQALIAVQGIINSPSSEKDFCEAILKHWGQYHRIKTKSGNDEERFRRIFCDLNPKTFERMKNKEVERIYDDYQEVKIRDMVRDFIRFGVIKGKTTEELSQIVGEQVEFLRESGEIPSAQDLPTSPTPTVRPSREEP